MIHLLQFAKACDTRARFHCSCDLDLQSMTLIYELDQKILKMHPHAKNKLSR